MTSETLLRPDGTSLVYDRFIPSQPAKAGVLFLHGFQSDRNATKAVFLDGACRRLGIPFIRYDAYAHGQSTAAGTNGAWEDFTITHAVHDALLVLDELTTGPQIIMGSSMGGWVALRVMEERPDRIAGMIGIATAPDFTKRIITPTVDYTPALLADGPANFVMDEDWTFNGPVHLLQGKLDESVPWETAGRVAAKFQDPAKVKVTLAEDGDHRLNRPEDLALQEQAILDVLGRI
jgi:pimeloyl-ACP methyl ester carboxylesterase